MISEVINDVDDSVDDGVDCGVDESRYWGECHHFIN